MHQIIFLTLFLNFVSEGLSAPILDTEEGRYNDGEQKENVCSICLNKMEIGTTDIETNLKNEIQTKVGNEMPKAETTPKNETGEIGEENKMENDVTDDDSKNVDPDKLKTLQNCQHIFHETCVDKWLLEHNTCPECRATVESGEVLSPTADAQGSSSSTRRNRQRHPFATRDDDDDPDPDDPIYHEDLGYVPMSRYQDARERLRYIHNEQDRRFLQGFEVPVDDNFQQSYL